jgi:hypothetical protein
MRLRLPPNPPLAGSSFNNGRPPLVTRKVEGAGRSSRFVKSAAHWARSGSILLLSILAAVSVTILKAAETDQEVEARKAALDLAGAFSNDGFKMRDGHWCGTIKPHEHALIAVNLYAGNQYWFTAGATAPAKKLAVNVYDEAGNQVSTETYDAGERAAAGFSPTSSGQYYVSVGLVEGKESSLCLVYSYK